MKPNALPHWAFWIGVALTAALGIALRGAANQAMELSSWVTESNETRIALVSLREHVRHAESAQRGFRLAIDDYGTGYASLEQLTRITFNELKIDRSFVKNALLRESARVVLESSLDMAHRLGIAAIAEGIESERSWTLLSELKCDLAQGHYIAPPMAAADYAAWMSAWSGMPSPVS